MNKQQSLWFGIGAISMITFIMILLILIPANATKNYYKGYEAGFDWGMEKRLGVNEWKCPAGDEVGRYTFENGILIMPSGKELICEKVTLEDLQ